MNTSAASEQMNHEKRVVAIFEDGRTALLSDLRHDASGAITDALIVNGGYWLHDIPGAAKSLTEATLVPTPRAMLHDHYNDVIAWAVADAESRAQEEDLATVTRAAVDALAWTIRFIDSHARSASGPAVPELQKARSALDAALDLGLSNPAPIYAYVKEGFSSGKTLHTFNSVDDAQQSRLAVPTNEFSTSEVFKLPGAFASKALTDSMMRVVKAAATMPFSFEMADEEPPQSHRPR